MAGMVAKIFEHPFDLGPPLTPWCTASVLIDIVKVRLQSQPTDRPLSFKGPFDCFKQTYLNEGIKGLYRVSSLLLWGSSFKVSRSEY
jgi:ornithine carrier protein